jgi:hypothetical protein
MLKISICCLIQVKSTYTNKCRHCLLVENARILRRYWKRVKQILKLVVIVSMLFMSGCATSKYTTHYGFFDAENSDGELRQFRVVWETVEVESWKGKRFYALPLRLETQCSDRVLRFYDATARTQRACIAANERGIAYCGDASKDNDPRGLPIKNNSICGTVTNAVGAQAILRLKDEVHLTLVCEPKNSSRRDGRKKVNQDYLKPSVQPYVVATKAVEGQDSDGHVPKLWNHSSVCDPEAR